MSRPLMGHGRMNKLEIRDYLQNIYKLQVAKVATHIQMGVPCLALLPQLMCCRQGEADARARRDGQAVGLQAGVRHAGAPRPLPRWDPAHVLRAASRASRSPSCGRRQRTRRSRQPRSRAFVRAIAVQAMVGSRGKWRLLRRDERDLDGILAGQHHLEALLHFVQWQLMGHNRLRRVNGCAAAKRRVRPWGCGPWRSCRWPCAVVRRAQMHTRALGVRVRTQVPAVDGQLWDMD